MDFSTAPIKQFRTCSFTGNSFILLRGGTTVESPSTEIYMLLSPNSKVAYPNCPTEKSTPPRAGVKSNSSIPYALIFVTALPVNCVSTDALAFEKPVFFIL